ncbi:MAG TPA: hypothetical protein VKP64_01630 [Mycobacteriales bacterium]|nr:hypothetical protein [Mycobacteriales bacterium]
MSAGTHARLVEVHLLDFDVYQRAREHNEELRREFALLALPSNGGPPDGSGRHALPRRLTTLIEHLSAEYTGSRARSTPFVMPRSSAARPGSTSSTRSR